ncbi:hypothetical protein G9H71_21725, partial [Motilibacter sp. E257]
MASRPPEGEDTWPDRFPPRPGSGDGLGAWDSLVIPDDARELEPDRRAWLRELRQQRRDRWLPQGPAAQRSRTVLLFALVAGLILALSAPALLLSPQPPRGSLPLAAAAGPDAVAGGLLPDVELRTLGSQPIDARAARPAVLMLLPAGECDCHPLVLDVVARARAAGVYPWLVT